MKNLLLKRLFRVLSTLGVSILALGASIAPTLATAAEVSMDVSPTSNQNEGNSGTRQFSFILRISEAQADDVTVRVSTNDRSASAEAGDYVSFSNQEFTIPAGNTQTTIPVTVNGDTIDEPDEDFEVRISSVEQPHVVQDGRRLVLGVIQNDDNPPTISINNVVTSEAAGTASFDVTLSNPSQNEVQVNFETADGTAVGGADASDGDYITREPETLTFAGVAGPDDDATLVQNAVITINQDNRFEGNNPQNFFVNLSNPSNAVLGDAQGEGQITDSDDPPNLTIANASAAETDGTLTFTVSVEDRVSEVPVAVNFSTGADGDSAVAGSDYLGRSGTLNIPAETASGTIDITLLEDAIDEADETFTLELSNPTNAQIASDPPSATGTIQDSNDPPVISFASTTVTGTESEGADLIFTISLSAPSDQQVTAEFSTTDDTAVAGSDYTNTVETVTFSPGSQQETVEVRLLNDDDHEADETFIAVLDSPVNATIEGASGDRQEATATIVDDEPKPVLSIGDETVDEDDGTITVTAELNNPGTTDDATSSVDISFNFETSDTGGTATEGVDYFTAAGQRTILAGQSSVTFDITLVDDDISELTETFFVNLSGTDPDVVTVNDSSATMTIQDNETAPTVSINSPTVSEGAGNMFFLVELSRASGGDISMDFATADDSATAGQDYVASSGTLTIPAGETSAAISIAIIDDQQSEATQDFDVQLSNLAGNATFVSNNATETGTGSITDNEAAPQITVADVSVNESDGSAILTIALSNSSESQITVDFATADQDPQSAQANFDYGTTSGTATFAPGETQFQVSITIQDDPNDENSETFDLNLTNASAPALIADGQAEITIIDDDGTYSFVGDVVQDEGDGGDTTTFAFTVRRNGPAFGEAGVTVNLRPGSASSPGDVEPISNLRLDFSAPSGIDQTVNVIVSADDVGELDETFFLDLSNPEAGATIGKGTAIGTITDDDAPSITINDVSVNETDSDATFTVTKTGVSSLVVTVDALTADNTAIQPADYSATSQQLSFQAGGTLVQTQTFTVPIQDDFLDEEDESFFVNLSNAQNAEIGDAQGQGTILDDEEAQRLRIGDVTADESEGSADFVVTLNPVSDSDVTVDFLTSDGTAVAPDDYSARTGRLTIAAGETSGIISIPLNNDSEIENTENFVVTISNPSAGTSIDDASGTATITDDDRPATISLAASSSDNLVTTGSTVTFTADLTAASDGGSANDVVVAIELHSSGFSIDSVTSCSIVQGNPILLSCDLGSVPAGESRQINVVGQPNDVEDVFMLARANSSNAPGVEAFVVTQTAETIVTNAQDDTEVANAVTVTADLDGDGDQDAIVAGSDSASSTRVLLNDGQGNLTVATNFGDSLSTLAMVLADLDGDGDVDLAMANGPNAGQVVLNGGNAFASRSNRFLQNANAVDVVAVNVDGDADIDLIFANGGSNPSTVYLNDGNANFTAVQTGIGDVNFDANGLATANFNGDAFPDLVIANGSPNEILFGNGDGTFTAQPSIGNGTSNDVVVLDVNGDGISDLVFAQTAQGDGGTIVVAENQVFLGVAGGTFQAGTAFGRAESLALAVDDVNNDGLDDIVVVNETGGNQVFISNGNGLFTQSGAVIETDARSAVLADLDGDGDNDVIVGSRVLLNNGAGELTVVNRDEEPAAIPIGADSGGSCSMGRSGSPVDPTLPLLAVIAMLGMLWRRRAALNSVN